MNKNQQVLDIAMLEQYIKLVGPSLIIKSLVIFEKMMLGYLAILNSKAIIYIACSVGNMIIDSDKNIIDFLAS